MRRFPQFRLPQQEWEYVRRLEKLQKYLRARLYGYGRHATLEALRHVERLHKDYLKKKRAFHQVHWMPTTLETSVEEILFEAVSKGLTFAAMDTEYRKIKGESGAKEDTKTIQITEIGFSYYDGNKIHAHHYALAGGKGKASKKFLHGETQRYPLERFIIPEMRDQMRKVDVILFWNKQHDIEALASIGVEVPAKKIVDIHQWQTRPNRRCEHGFNAYNLKEFCAIQGVELRGVHNAGNDAYCLLQAALLSLGVLGEPFELIEKTHERNADSQSGQSGGSAAALS